MSSQKKKIKKTTVFVFTNPTESVINRHPTKKLGVWEDGYEASENPIELSLYKKGQEPSNLPGRVHGIWGVRFGGDTESCSPEDLVCLAPNNKGDKPPSNFEALGKWAIPKMTKNATHVTPNTTTFLQITKNEKKKGKYEVGGQWDALYSSDTVNEHTQEIAADELAPSAEYGRYPLFDMDIEIGSGKSANIVVNNGDKALDVAEKFCSKHNLPDNFVEIISETIQQQIDTLS